MSGDVVAGIDVGNSTTEIVLVDATRTPPLPLAWDRAPTRGRKGSVRAAQAAALLTRRLANRAGLTPVRAVLARQRPVLTWTRTLTRARPETGRLRVLATSVRTPGRAGYGVGRPVPVTAAPRRDGRAVVLVVPADLPFGQAATLIDEWAGASGDVRAVLVGADEGVLVARRLRVMDGPVIDGVDVASALAARLVAVEVAAPGEVVRQVADPLRLVAAFGLHDGERAGARTLARELADCSNAVIALGEHATPPARAPSDEPGEQVDPADDVWCFDLARVWADVEARRGGPGGLHVQLLAALAPAPDDPPEAVRDALAAALGVPVLLLPSEAAAARAGALSTPGVRGDALVLDLGGGTIDAIDAIDGIGAEGREVVVAGAGDLITAAVAAALAIPLGAAEWAKRGPSGRLEGPHVVLGESGERTFLDRPAAPDAIGALTVAGPAGQLPISRHLAPAEWRALRLRIKRMGLGDNVARALAGSGSADPGLTTTGREAVLIGGVAGDPEILRALDGPLSGALVGRGDIAGCLGHRWAVAYGLVLASRDL